MPWRQYSGAQCSLVHYVVQCFCSVQYITLDSHLWSAVLWRSQKSPVHMHVRNGNFFFAKVLENVPRIQAKALPNWCKFVPKIRSSCELPKIPISEDSDCPRDSPATQSVLLYCCYKRRKKKEEVTVLEQARAVRTVGPWQFTTRQLQQK